MKEFPPALSAHIATGMTTLCWCWRITRQDGVRQGFTDHDNDVVFDGTDFEAASGFSASEVKDQLGLSVDNLEVTGAISAESLNEADLAAGLYDDAKVEIFRVNWQDPAQRALMRTGSLGEVKRAGSAFAAEVRGLAHYLQQPQGRVFQYTCDADVGDARCKINLGSAGYTGAGTVLSVTDARRFEASGLNSFANEWFTQGLLTFTSGAALAQKIEVKRHSKAGGTVTIELWQPAREPLLPGETFTVTAGCNKTIETCKAKYSNVANFRGFPHMPGNDALARIARPGAK